MMALNDCRFVERVWKKKKTGKEKNPWDTSMFAYFINKHHGSRSWQGMQWKWGSVHCHFNCGDKELWIAFILKNLVQRSGGITSIKDFFWIPTCFLWNLKQKSPSYYFNILQQGLILKTLDKVVKNWETHSCLRAAPKVYWNITKVSVRMNVNFTTQLHIQLPCLKVAYFICES